MFQTFQVGDLVQWRAGMVCFSGTIMRIVAGVATLAVPNYGELPVPVWELRKL